MGYLANFMVYTLAMVGVIVVALLIFKNATSPGGGKSSKYLKVIDSMSLGQRKMLYIVSTGKEQFLIAGDVDKTSLISKLDSAPEVIQNISPLEQKEDIEESFKDAVAIIKQKSRLKQSIGINSTSNAPYTSVMKNIAYKIKD